jgi:hypothetical protein
MTHAPARIVSRLPLLLFLVLAGHAARSEAADAGQQRTPGLIGTAQKNGEPSQVAYHYPHGKVFPPDLIRQRFHDGRKDLPSVRIELVGYVEVDQETTVDIYHAAGGVNGDHGTLYIDGRQVGQVGDDTVKNVIYTRTLPAGLHEVRWVLTGGLFQPNLLKFQDSAIGELLSMFHTAAQREETGASRAALVIDAQGEVAGWPPATDAKAWTRLASHD